MTAPTPPGVVPADDVRELVERLRYADQHSPQRIVGSRIFCEAADMLERLANRPSLTEDEFQIVGYLKPAESWTLNPVFVPAQSWSDHPWMQAVFTIPVYGRALADRSEPRQEKEGSDA